ncbi:MAG: ATP-binding protein [Anaerolineae bacterium]|nr:ATP-binding protein [Anaerolineae bacterium]
MRKFDLNMEKVLENWDVSDALREIIANAIDEQLLTNTREVEIFKNASGWHIRDFGRGLRYQHLTQNENSEKLNSPNLVIGKFGVGLKDALATLDRHRIIVSILLRHGDIELGKSSKQGFDDVITLHALISEPSDSSFVGTEFILKGITQKQIERAKSFFLKFSDEKLLEDTKYGHVLRRGKHGARIFISGVRVAEEDNFLFSYNITSMTQSMRKALNRERTHVGRSAYADRVKDILLECRQPAVAEIIVGDLKQFETGKSHDELKWIDVAVHGCKLLNASGKYIFLTPMEYLLAASMVDSAIADGYKVVTIPENVKQRIRGLKDLLGQPIRDLDVYAHQWNESFEFTFVKPDELTHKERMVFDRTKDILRLAGGKPPNVKKILISETMRLQGFDEAVGVWEENEQRIVIKRSQLRNLREYAGALLHETAHARSGGDDLTRKFEDGLTDLLGTTSSQGLD